MNAKGFRTKKGGKTNLNSISRLLQNRHYIGEYHYKDIVTPGGIPAIVPIELFDAVQERLKTNKKAPAKHKAEDDYFLTTKIFCADCKSPMAGESGTSHTSIKYHYYKCSNAKKHKGCKRKAIRKDLIEGLVLSYAKKILEDDEYIKNLIIAIIAESKRENTLLPMLKREKVEVEKRIRNMLDAIQDGIYTASTKQRLEELEARKEDIEVQIAMEELGRTQINEDMLYMWFDKMKNLDINSLDYKRIFLDVFVNSVYVKEDGIELILNYKEGTKIIPFEQKNNFFNKGSDLSPPARPKTQTCLFTGLCF